MQFNWKKFAEDVTKALKQKKLTAWEASKKLGFDTPQPMYRVARGLGVNTPSAVVIAKAFGLHLHNYVKIEA